MYKYLILKTVILGMGHLVRMGKTNENVPFLSRKNINENIFLQIMLQFIKLYFTCHNNLLFLQINTHSYLCKQCVSSGSALLAILSLNFDRSAYFKKMDVTKFEGRVSFINSGMKGLNWSMAEFQLTSYDYESNYNLTWTGLYMDRVSSFKCVFIPI